MRMVAFRRAIPVAVILAVVASLLSPPVPAHANSTHTWTTEADFKAGVLSRSTHHPTRAPCCWQPISIPVQAPPVPWW